jgi:hypothetical protein
LTASAPGYVTENRTLTYERDAIIDLMLKRAAAQPAMPAPQAAPAPGTDLRKAPRAKTSIDEEDPYK